MGGGNRVGAPSQLTRCGYGTQYMRAWERGAITSARTSKASELDYLAEDSVHVGDGERAQRLRAHATELADAQPQRRHGDIIGRLERRDDVIAAERPVDVLDRNTELLRHRLDRLGPLGRVHDVLDALFGEVRQHDICCHRESSLLIRAPWAPGLPPHPRSR